MKYISIILSGISDRTYKELDGKTPFSKADTPNFDKLAESSVTGLIQTVPTSFTPVGDAGALTAAGYPPQEYYTGRAGFELLGNGFSMKKDDVVFFCSLVCLSENDVYEESTILEADPQNISSEEKAALIEAVKSENKNRCFEFLTAKNGCSFLVWHKGEPAPGKLLSPGRIIGKTAGSCLPKGDFTPVLVNIMKRSREILETHPINQKRRALGLNALNSIWLWCVSSKPELEKFRKRFGLKACAVSTSSYFSGIAVSAGISVTRTQSTLSPIKLKRTAVNAINKLLRSNDLVFVYLDILTKCRSAKEKAYAIELIDKFFIFELMERTSLINESFKLTISSDHAFPVCSGKPSPEAVPILYYLNEKAPENQNR